MNITTKEAQSISEYILVITIATLVVATMFPAMKRSISSVIKSTADQVGVQKNAEQNFEDGYLISSSTHAQAIVDHTRKDFAYTVTTEFADETKVDTTNISNLGFSEGQ